MMQSVSNIRPRQGLYIFERCTVDRRTLLFKLWYPEMVVFHVQTSQSWRSTRVSQRWMYFYLTTTCLPPSDAGICSINAMLIQTYANAWIPLYPLTCVQSKPL